MCWELYAAELKALILWSWYTHNSNEKMVLLSPSIYLGMTLKKVFDLWIFMVSKVNIRLLTKNQNISSRALTFGSKKFRTWAKGAWAGEDLLGFRIMCWWPLVLSLLMVKIPRNFSHVVRVWHKQLERVDWASFFFSNPREALLKLLPLCSKWDHNIFMWVTFPECMELTGCPVANRGHSITPPNSCQAV